ncbi:hypothetical protein ACKFKF_12130 [Phormidesmis sp. 146-12]
MLIVEARHGEPNYVTLCQQIAHAIVDAFKFRSMLSQELKEQVFKLSPSDRTLP